MVERSRRRIVFVAVTLVAALALIMSLARPAVHVFEAAAAPGTAASGPLGVTDVHAEVAYALAHWSDRNVGKYGSLGHDDCVNFASQALVARGWRQTPDWWHSQSLGVNHYSPAWISSTAFANYLSAHPELATPLTDGQRSRVAVGDIVQFDWDDSGNRDHTGIVTRIGNHDGHIEVYYASHSNDRRDMSVDEALHLDGGTAYYWHLLQ